MAGMRFVVLAAVLAAVSTACSANAPRSPGAAPTNGAALSQPPSMHAPADELARKMVQCMGDKGWDVKVHPDGGLEANYPNDQAERYIGDNEQCREETGFGRSSPVTAEQAAKIYDELLRVADCVRALGYDVSEPPSKQAYVEGLMNGRLPWHPYSNVFEDGPNEAARRQLNDKCPIHEPTT